MAKLSKRRVESDRALLLRAICAGIARWEPFSSNKTNGEVCVGGLRYLTFLDKDGCPELFGLMRKAIESRLVKND